MEVILLERVDKLGNMGEVVSVKNGYGRNFLLPQGKALRSNKANLAKFEAQRAALEARNAELRGEAQTEANKIDGHKFVVIRQASETGALYGSVSTRDVADQLKAEGFTIERKQIQLEQPIKELAICAPKKKLPRLLNSTFNRCSMKMPTSATTSAMRVAMTKRLRKPAKKKIHRPKACVRSKRPDPVVACQTGDDGISGRTTGSFAQ